MRIGKGPVPGPDIGDIEGAEGSSAVAGMLLLPAPAALVLVVLLLCFTGVV